MEKHFVSEGEQFAVFVKHGRIVVRLATVFVDRTTPKITPIPVLASLTRSQ